MNHATSLKEPMAMTVYTMTLSFNPPHGNLLSPVIPMWKAGKKDVSDRGSTTKKWLTAYLKDCLQRWGQVTYSKAGRGEGVAFIGVSCSMFRS